MVVFPLVFTLFTLCSVQSLAKSLKDQDEMLIKDDDTLRCITNGLDTELEDMSSRNPCPKGFTLLRDRRCKMWCVFIGANKVSWFEALIICKIVLKDAILMELYDPVIAKNVQTLVYKYNEADRYRGYWVGGTNFFDNRTFYWEMHSRQPIDRKLWDTNEPSYTGHSEYCTELRAWNGKLNDDECHKWKNYVCGKQVHA